MAADAAVGPLAAEAPDGGKAASVAQAAAAGAPSPGLASVPECARSARSGSQHSSPPGSRGASVAAAARNSAAPVDAALLVRSRYRQFLAAQVLASNLVPIALLVRLARLSSSLLAPAAAPALLALTCLCLSSLCALAFLYARCEEASRDRLLTALVRLEHVQMSVLSLALLHEAIMRTENCPRGDASAVACAASYFHSVHATLILKWVVTQTPVRIMVLPETARNAAVAAATLAYAHARQPGGVSAELLRDVLARAAAVTLAAPLLCALCHGRTFTTSHLPAVLSSSDGRAAGRFADALTRACKRAASAVLPESIMSATALTGVSMGVVFSIAVNGGLGGGFCDVCRRVNAVVSFSLLIAGATKIQAGTSTGRDMLERRLGRSSSVVSSGLETRLADAGSEHEVLRCAAEAAHALFPQARAQALVSLADARSLRPAYVEAAAEQEHARAALHAALAVTDAQSSAAFVCGAGGAPVADSRDWAVGCAAFSDWRAGLEAGLGASQLVTARFNAGAQPAGYMLLAFGAERGFPSNDVAALDALRAICDFTGAALLRRRAADAAGAAAVRLAHVERLAADIFPSHLLESVADRMYSDAPAPLVEHHACVSVIFADVVQWTQRAASMTPEKAMLLLDCLWQRFDSLCSAHGVYKVETIGDSYLAVCGMHPPRRDHAQAALRFALDLHAAAAAPTPGGDEGFSIRVGVHSGPLTSGVVGHMRQRWCIFVESNGRPGNVQLSDVTLKLSGLDAALVPSRQVDIKGKGQMHTFVLEAGSAEALAARAVLEAAPAARDDEDLFADLAEPLDADHHGNMSDDDDAPPLSFPPAGVHGLPPTTSSSSGPGSMNSSMGLKLATGDAAEAAAGAASRRAHAHAVSALLLGTCGPLGFCTYWCLYLSGGSRFLISLGVFLGSSFVAALPLLAAGHRDALAVSLSRPLVLKLCVAVCLGCDLVGHSLAQYAWCSRVAPGPGCEIQFYWDFHAIMGATAPLTSMLPVHLALAPELVRFLVLMGTAVTLQRAQLTAAMLARLLLHGVASLVLTPLVLVCAVDVPAGVHSALEAVETCPAACRPLRDKCAAFYLRQRERLLGKHEPPLLERTGLAVFGLRVIKIIHFLLTAEPHARTDGSALQTGCRDLNTTLVLVMASSALSRVSLRTAGGGTDADAIKARLHVAAVLRELQEALASARSEAASLAAGAAALGALFPSASAVAVGAFAQGASCGVLSCVELSAADASARAALAAALPTDVGGTAGTAVSRACRAASRTSTVIDSRDCEAGLAECADWAAAVAAGGGVAASRALTVPLTAGPVVVGFATVFLTLFHVDDGATPMHSVLREAAGVIGGALFVRRAFAVNRDVDVRPASAPQRTAAADAAAALDGAAAYPSSDADTAALALLDARRAADHATLDSWSLDAQALPAAELQRLLGSMLHSLGLFRRFRLSPTAFADFVADTATHYNENPFHNFAHCFMVAHQCWLFLRDDATRALLLEIDHLALLLAAICHDVEHPGTTNSYQVATGSVLALRYNDTSVLESHHAAVGFTTLQRSRVLATLGAEELQCLRRTFVAAVLATDMANHKQLLAKVAAAVASGSAEEEPAEVNPSARRMSIARQPVAGGSFARRQPEERQLLVAFLLHCADLGNPLRPWNLSERIAVELQREFEAQAARERAAGLPVSVMLAATDEAKSKLELGFLEYVVQPLYVTLAAVVPRLGDKCLKLIAANKAAWSARIVADK